MGTAFLPLWIGLAVHAATSSEDVSVLLLGVVKLAGSEHAISAAQAQQLLPLVEAWRAELVQSWGITRGASATAAAIRSILTSEQLSDILVMRLRPADAVRWGSGCSGRWTVATPCFCGACPEDPLRPGEVPDNLLFLGPLVDNPFLEFADRVTRILAGWASGK